MKDLLVVARDAALILLAIEALVGLSLPLVALVYATRSLRRFAPMARSGFTLARARVARLADATARTCSAVEEPVVTYHAAAAGFSAGWRHYRKAWRRRRQGAR